MKPIKIRNHTNKKIIYEGNFNNIIECLDQATQDNVNLEYADLRYTNLQCINIDSSKLSYADFCGANLNHANISEAKLNNIDFSGASLIGACLAESDLTGSCFRNVSFGATDITESNLDHCLFSTLSALQLPFQDASSMKFCLYENVLGQQIQLSQPPIVISGLMRCPIALIGDSILIGHRILPINILRSVHTQKFIQSKIDKLPVFN